MPLLLTESLDSAEREMTHQHIEGCALCQNEWGAMRETWDTLAELPEVEVPASVRERFLAEVTPASTASPNVVPFHRRRALKWLAQAAAVVVVAGGSYFAGHRGAPIRLPETEAQITNVEPARYSIAESRVLQATALSPDIQGRPNIRNVEFVDSNPTDGTIGVSFDVTSHVTVTGRPEDKSMVRLLSYVMQNKEISPSRSRTIDLVRETYGNQQTADPEIAQALAKVLRNEDHVGVRINAAETLKSFSPTASDDSTRSALIEALRSDPNPAVRIKAVEALANLASSGVTLDQSAIDALREKASEQSENPYVRVKAAEALSNLRP